MKKKLFAYIFKAVMGFALGAFLVLPLIANAKTIDDTSIETIAKSVVKEGDSDLLKAKKLAIFVATHFERDGFLEKEKYNAGRKNKIYEKPYQNNMLESKIGDSQDFAKLYQALCQSVGLEATIINGYANKRIRSHGRALPKQKAVRDAFKMVGQRQDALLENQSASWNKVNIKGQWIVVDTYWMVKGDRMGYKNVSSPRQMEKILERGKEKPLKSKNTPLDMRYFNANEKEFLKTHLVEDF